MPWCCFLLFLDDDTFALWYDLALMHTIGW